jgi:hypothetical protein
MKRITELDTGTGYDSPKPVNSFDEVVKHMATSKGKRTRENWILRTFFEVHNRELEEPFEWVECSESPDYRVFTRPDSEPLPVEVTELLEQERQRDREYKDAYARMKSRNVDYDARLKSPAPPNFENDLITHARSRLADKFVKPYPPGTWLIVYFNLTLYNPYWDDAFPFAMNILQKAVASLPRPAAITQLCLLANGRRIATIDLANSDD